MMFSIDGIEWPWPCDVSREAEVASSRISGLMLDRSYFNDVLGTYMAYTVTLAVPADERDRYARLYEALSNPVDGHRFVLPYGQGTVEVTGRVSRVSDVYVRGADGAAYWRGGRFTVIANYPTKAPVLGQVIAAGRAPYPAVAAPVEGEGYVWSAGAWVPAEKYDDGDGREY